MSNDQRIEIDFQDARQGESDVGLRYMLAGSLTLVVIAFVLLYLLPP